MIYANLLKELINLQISQLALKGNTSCITDFVNSGNMFTVKEKNISRLVVCLVVIIIAK